MRTRLLVLLLTITGGLSLTFAVTRALPIRKTALPGDAWLRGSKGEMTLPALVGNWSAGPSLNPTDKEITVLAKDTGFSKRNYLRSNYEHRSLQTQDTPEDEREGIYEEVACSIVTAGSDMGNSIHRPERCLTAQGWNLSKGKKMIIDLKGKKLPVTKLYGSKVVRTENDDGSFKEYKVENVTYYWFVGNDRVTESHLTRTFADLKDRVTTSTDQEWAYASISVQLDPHWAELEQGSASNGNKPSYARTRRVDDKAVDRAGLTDADRLLHEFIKEFCKDVLDAKMIKKWAE
jgi:hypothetical protein